MLFEFGQGDKTLHDAVSKAYEQSLRRYHGIFARHVFSVSVWKIFSSFDGRISFSLLYVLYRQNWIFFDR